MFATSANFVFHNIQRWGAKFDYFSTLQQQNISHVDEFRSIKGSLRVFNSQFVAWTHERGDVEQQRTACFKKLRASAFSCLHSERGIGVSVESDSLQTLKFLRKCRTSCSVHSRRSWLWFYTASLRRERERELELRRLRRSFTSYFYPEKHQATLKAQLHE